MSGCRERGNELSGSIKLGQFIYICCLYRSTRLSCLVHLYSVPNFKADLNNNETCQLYETVPVVNSLIFIWLVQVMALRLVRCGRLSSGTAEGSV